MRRTSFIARRTGGALGGACLAALLATGACGGGSGPHAKTPKGGAGASSGVVGAPVSNAQGQQLGISAGAAVGEELSGDAKDAYDRGFQAWAAGDLAGAKAAFMDAASRAPKAGGPRYSLGCVLERLGDTQGALDAYKAAFTANPKYEPAVGAYALLLARTGHGGDAEQMLSDRRAQSDSVALMVYLAEVKSIEGDSPGCQQLAQQALAKQPDDKDAMVVIARDYYRSHRWDLARYALQAILDGASDGSIPPRDPGNPDALLLRALIERESGQRKEALADFEQAVSKRPDMVEALVNLGEMKLEAGNATEAQAPLEKAVRYAPNLAVAHLDLGDCYRLLGRPGDAKAQFDKALALDSTLAGVHYDLGLLYLFSPNAPGVSSRDDQLARAIQELETYKSMRSAKTSRGPGSDVDDLLSTAKRKRAELQMKQQAAAQAAAAASAAPAAPAAASSSSAPAPSNGGGNAPAPASSGSDIVRELPK